MLLAVRVVAPGQPARLTFAKPAAHSLAEAAEPALRSAYREMAGVIREGIHRADLLDALAAGSEVGVYRALDLDPRRLSPVLGRPVARLFEKAGEGGLDALLRAIRRRPAKRRAAPGRVDTRAGARAPVLAPPGGLPGATMAPNPPTRKAPKLVGRFDVLNPRALRWIAQHTGDLITEVTVQQRLAVRRIIDLAFREGLHPRESSKLIYEVVGLRSDQAETLLNYREGLLADDLTAGEIAEAIGRRADELRASRAILIARHETIYAAYAGERESWRQAFEQELLGDQAIQEWVITGDDRLCEICEPLEGKTAKLDEPFADGIYQPGDPHPQCRCAVVMRPWGAG